MSDTCSSLQYIYLTNALCQVWLNWPNSRHLQLLRPIGGGGGLFSSLQYLYFTNLCAKYGCNLLNPRIPSYSTFSWFDVEHGRVRVHTMEFSGTAHFFLPFMQWLTVSNRRYGYLQNLYFTCFFDIVGCQSSLTLFINLEHPSVGISLHLATQML